MVDDRPMMGVVGIDNIGMTYGGRPMMGVVGIDNIGMTYGGRPEPPLPSDASSTIYIEDLTANCTRREVSHIVMQNIN
jgi:hypothetical protein